MLRKHPIWNWSQVITKTIESVILALHGSPVSFIPVHTISDCDCSLHKAMRRAFWNGASVPCECVGGGSWWWWGRGGGPNYRPLTAAPLHEVAGWGVR